MEIGEKLRNLRLNAKLTQQELADRLGFTKGYISQIENDLTSPSMLSLFQILEALGTSLEAFFSPYIEPKIIFTKNDYNVEEDRNLKHNITRLIPNTLEYELGSVILEIDAGGQTKIYERGYGVVFGHVLEGQITLVKNKTRYTIKKNESFYYETNQEHYILNTHNERAKILCVSKPKVF